MISTADRLQSDFGHWWNFGGVDFGRLLSGHFRVRRHPLHPAGHRGWQKFRRHYSRAEPYFPQVIPFLVLAVGVDNIFILVQNVQREPIPKNCKDPAALMVARALGHVGPSMLLTSVSEITCFFLGNIGGICKTTSIRPQQVLK
jgi:Sterol-sensing domain of SREBP cleavage-activation